MLSRISIKNFKSAKYIDLPLKALTVLTGLNGSGKSTLLQAIALFKQSLVRGVNQQSLKLNGELVTLGRSEDILFENTNDDDICFTVVSDGVEIELSVPMVPNKSELPMRVEGDIEALLSKFDHGFQIVLADRIVPASNYIQNHQQNISYNPLGCRGEYTVDFLSKNESFKVSKKRTLTNDIEPEARALAKQVSPTGSLLDQTAAWLQYVSPGVRPRAFDVQLADVASLRFSYTGLSVESTSKEHRPHNVGFGLTYCLPIVVACLSAPSGSILILENPEAHLHPRGQSALGRLLALCAADGVQVLLETHSDHVVNGIRIAAKQQDIDCDEVAMHYFKRDLENGESSVQSPTLSKDGKFDVWPDGFVDEWGRALDKLLDV